MTEEVTGTGPPPWGDLALIDTMVAIPEPGTDLYGSFRGALRDTPTSTVKGSPINYLFGNDAPILSDGDPVTVVLSEMDRHGVQSALIQIADGSVMARKALLEHPDRFFACYGAEPDRGMADVRAIVRLHEEVGLKAISAFPAGSQVGLDDRRWWPIYTKCVELDLPFVTTIGVPGPRLPAAPQHPMLLDELCYMIPEMTVVTRHGGEPWVDLVVKLLRKWPNLYYSTSAFTPRRYPPAIIDFANKHGAEKVLYAGYYPIGLTLERIVRELRSVPFRDEVWPLFLHDNAARIFGLTEAQSKTPIGSLP